MTFAGTKHFKRSELIRPGCEVRPVTIFHTSGRTPAASQYYSVDDIEGNLCHVALFLEELRRKMGRPLSVTSGYRPASHNAERGKAKGPGIHTIGLAVDVAVFGSRDRALLHKYAAETGATRFGIARRFLHIDWYHEDTPNHPSDVMWLYK